MYYVKPVRLAVNDRSYGMHLRVLDVSYIWVFIASSFCIDAQQRTLSAYIPSHNRTSSHVLRRFSHLQVVL